MSKPMTEQGIIERQTHKRSQHTNSQASNRGQGTMMNYQSKYTKLLKVTFVMVITVLVAGTAFLTLAINPALADSPHYIAPIVGEHHLVIAPFRRRLMRLSAVMKFEWPLVLTWSQLPLIKA